MQQTNSHMLSERLKKHIKDYHDFPKKGIIFKDISPILENYEALEQVKNNFVNVAKEYQPDYIAGIDARGFLFSTLISQELGIGSLMIRKPNKLPGELIEQTYTLEYGSSTLAVQTARNIKNKKIILVDDLLATGGTIKCAEDLISKAGGNVVLSLVVIELLFLKGSENLVSPLKSVLQYD